MTDKVYAKQKGLIKGVAFPTAVSVNNLLCHVSPTKGDQTDKPLQAGDLAKIELGVHIDGFPALVCHSLVVGQDKVTGRTADLLQAAHLSAEAAIRLLRDGNTAKDVRQAVLNICKDHKVNPIEGMMCHSMAKDSLSVNDLSIIFKPTDVQSRSMVDPAFQDYQVWCVDVAVSMGQGQVSPHPNHKTTIFAKNEGVTYALKLKGSRTVFSEVQQKFGCMAFQVRALEDQVKARMALSECISHQLIQPYEVQAEKADVITARFMFTAFLLPAGPLRLTETAFDQSKVCPDAKISSPELQALLDAPIRPKKK